MSSESTASPYAKQSMSPWSEGSSASETWLSHPKTHHSPTTLSVCHQCYCHGDYQRFCHCHYHTFASLQGTSVLQAAPQFSKQHQVSSVQSLSMSDLTIGNPSYDPSRTWSQAMVLWFWSTIDCYKHLRPDNVLRNGAVFILISGYPSQGWASDWYQALAHMASWTGAVLGVSL